jgi:hypothetical protein
MVGDGINGPDCYDHRYYRQQEDASPNAQAEGHVCVSARLAGLLPCTGVEIWHLPSTPPV